MNLFLIKKTLLYRLVSGHKYGHRIHSPFVFDLIRSVFRASSKVPFFNPIFPKAVMNDFGEMVRQKIDGIRKQKKNVEMINDMFIRSIEETSFNVEVLSDMIYQKILEE